MDILGLIFDSDYLIDSANIDKDLNWLEAYELYKSSYVGKCLAPNKLFAEKESWIFTKEGEVKECNLKELETDINLDSLDEYIFSRTIGQATGFFYELLKKNFFEIVKFSPQDLENIIKINMAKGDFVEILFKAINSNETFELSKHSIEYLETLLTSLTKSINEIDSNQDKKTNSEYQKKKEQWSDIANLSSGMLMHYAINFADDPKYFQNLKLILSEDKTPRSVREAAFNKFAGQVSNLSGWENERFNKFAEFLPIDTGSNIIAHALFNAQKYHNYNADLNSLKYFEPLLDQSVIKDAAVSFIGKSLEVMLRKDSGENIKFLEERVSNLYYKAGSLTTGLTDIVFSKYNLDQNHFETIVIDILAEDRTLPASTLLHLKGLALSTDKPFTALFIANRLADNYVNLPHKVLESYIVFTNHENLNLKALAINLFNKEIIRSTFHNDKLTEALTREIPEVSRTQFTKIVEILSEVKLDDTQKAKLNFQQEVRRWIEIDDKEERINISKNLLLNVSQENIEYKISFLKLYLATQNIKFYQALKSEIDIAFNALGSNAEIKENSDYLELSKLIAAFKSYESNKDSNLLDLKKSQFVLTAEQKMVLNNFLQLISYDVIKHLYKVDWSSYIEAYNFISFIYEHQIEDIDLEFLDTSEAPHKIDGVYKTLLQKKIDLFFKQSKGSYNEIKVLEKAIENLTKNRNLQPELLYRLLDSASKQNKLSTLVKLFEKISDYKAIPEMLDRSGASLHDLLHDISKYESNILLSKVSKLINDNRYYITKDIKTLLYEIKELNAESQDSIISHLLQDKYFEEQLIKIQFDIKITNSKPLVFNATNALYLYLENNEFYISSDNQNIALSRISADALTKFKKASTEEQVTAEIKDLILKEAAAHDFLPEFKDLRPTVRDSHKPLDQWLEKDFLNWRKSTLTIDDNNIAEAIAVISQAASNTVLSKDLYPRPIQIITLLSLLKSTSGGLAQISTGEGKSLINAMFNIIQVINGRHPDVVTSSSVLAMRDVDDLKDFYQLFGITVAHNIGGSDVSGGKKCYLADIVYGDLLHFIGDSLRDISENVKFGRGFDLVVVDEVDNMFIDQNNMKVQLSGMIPGFDILSQALVYMRGTFSVINSMLRQKDNECYAEIPFSTNQTEIELEKASPEEFQERLKDIKTNSTLVGSDCKEYLTGFIANYTQEMIFAFSESRDNRSVIIPKHLEQFAENQLNNWIDSIFSSFYHKERQSYIIYRIPDETSRYQFPIIAPMDYENSGVIQHGLQWSNGLHQFLQIKHGLTMYPENVVSIFISYTGFFNKYKGNIYGVSGTLGLKHHHDFLKQIYGVDLSFIPTFIQKDIIEFPEIIVESNLEWKQEIFEIIDRKIKDHRAGLIIVETIAEVEELKQFITEKGYSDDKLFVYGTGSSEDEYPVGTKRELKAGEVIVATNLAGRGTDLKISPEVRSNGGLHVIMGMLSSSIRTQDQGYGRAARQGEPGSAQLVINLNDLYYTECTDDIKCLKNERDNREKDRLNEDELCKLPSLALKDELFESYVELRKEVDSPTGYKIILGKPQVMESKSIYLYRDNTQIKLIITKSQDQSQVFEVTNIIKSIDLKAFQHINTILLQSELRSSSLNKQDYEIIHFIAAREKYTDFSIIMERVENEFNKAVSEYKLTKEEEENLSSWINTFTNQYGNDKKRFFLSNLLRKDDDFEDLVIDKNNPPIETELVKAELRKKFMLWLEDRNLYNNRYEIEQIRENWGIWLKKYDPIFEKMDSCEFNSTAAIRLFHQEQEARLKSDFEEFKKEISDRKNQNKLIQNPSYLVLKAWQYLGIHDQQNVLSQAPTTVTKESKGWFSYYADKITESINYVWQQASFRVNFGGENYSPHNPLNSAVDFAIKAAELDNIHSWKSHNAVTYISMIKDGAGITSQEQAVQAHQVKEKFCHDSMKVIRNIQEWVIPAYDAQLAFLISNKIVNFQDDLAIQLIGSKEIYLAIIKAIENNVDIVAKSSGIDMIRIGRFVPMDEVAANINITEALLKASNRTADISVNGYFAMRDITAQINQNTTLITFASKNFMSDQIVAGGGYVFEITTFQLEEEDDDWFGTVFAAVIGIASICTGLWMINTYTSSIFATTFGSSLVMGGVGDLIQSLVSVISGQPIDFKNFINSKGMAIGVSLATAGMLSFIDSIHEIKLLHDNMDNIVKMAKDTSKMLAIATAVQGATMLVGAGLNRAARDMLDPESINEEATRAINEIIAAYKEALTLIFASDDFRETQNLMKSLINSINNVIASYQGRFYDDKTQFTRGVSSGVAGGILGGFMPGLGTIIDTGTKAYLGTKKDNEAMGKVTQGVRQSIEIIQKQSMKTAEMMQTKFIKDFDRERADAIFAAARNQNLIENDSIDYRACDRFNSIKLSEDLSKYKNGLVGSCNYVSKLMLARHETQFEYVRNAFVSSIVNLRVSIQKNDVMKPITGALAGEIGNPLGTKFVEYVTSNAKPAANDNKPGKPREKTDYDKDFEERHQTQNHAKKPNAKDPKGNYKVKSGDTLSEIAKNAGISLDELLSANPELKIYQYEKSCHIHYPGITPAPKEGAFGYTLAPWAQVEFTFDPLQHILMDPDINHNGNINDNAFGDGAIAATLTTLDQGTEEVFKNGVGKKSGWYKYHTLKMGAITSFVDYKMNLQEQRINCPTCDDRVNRIVAGVQTAVGNGLSGVGAAVGSPGGPVGSVGGAVIVSTTYSKYGNEYVGDLARPIAQYIIAKYDHLNKRK